MTVERTIATLVAGKLHPDQVPADLATDAELTAHAGAADPHTGYQRESEKQAASGYPGLDAAGFVVGNGFAFPAVEVASTNVNVLDDYQEGVWNPSVSFATPGDLAVTYSVRSGFYTKVGRIVIIRGAITTSAFTYTTASGLFRITGLPFTVGQIDFSTFAMAGYTKAGYTQLTFETVGAQTYGQVRASGSGVAAAILGVADVPSGGTLDIRIAGYYTV